MAPPRTRAYFFYGLNVVRALSITSLILVIASSILVMVTNIKAVNAFVAGQASGASNDTEDSMADCDYIMGSTVPNQAAGVFWAVVSSLLIFFQSVILILSELGWPIKFFDRYFPVLGSQFGLGALGIFQGLIGAQILSHHVDDFTLVAGFFIFSLGCLNMLLGLIFRESAKEKRCIASYQDGSKGILPTSNDQRPVFVNASPAFVSNMFTGDSEKPRDESPYSTWRSTDRTLDEKAGYGFGRQGEKAAGLRGFILQKPEESLPRYATPPPPASAPYAASPKMARNKSLRSSTSSFASPGPRRQVSIHSDDDDDDMYGDDNVHDKRTVTPPPTFRSSPTAI